MKHLLVSFCLAFALWTGASESRVTDEPPRIVVVVGAPGESEYDEIFRESASLWEKTCRDSGARLQMVGLGDSGATNDLEHLQLLLQSEPKETPTELWLVLIGHGTFDGREAKFNLRGPDLSAAILAHWLEPFRRPLAVIHTSSSSSPFLNKLSKPGRVIITATRSGYEVNFARFGRYFSAAIADPSADLDKDGQVSLLEGFLMAAHQVAEFYTTEGRLATEHALIDDNGDGMGTPPDWFRGIRAVKRAADGASPDGLRAHQFHLLRSEAERRLSNAVRQKRNELELNIEELRGAKAQMPPEEYYQRLETVLLELARLYESAERAEANEGSSAGTGTP